MGYHQFCLGVFLWGREGEVGQSCSGSLRTLQCLVSLLTSIIKGCLWLFGEYVCVQLWIPWGFINSCSSHCELAHPFDSRNLHVVRSYVWKGVTKQSSCLHHQISLTSLNNGGSASRAFCLWIESLFSEICLGRRKLEHAKSPAGRQWEINDTDCFLKVTCSPSKKSQSIARNRKYNWRRKSRERLSPPSPLPPPPDKGKGIVLRCSLFGLDLQLSCAFWEYSMCVSLKKLLCKSLCALHYLPWFNSSGSQKPECPWEWTSATQPR